VLLMRGISPPSTKHEIVALTVTTLGLNGIPFEKIFNIREDNFADTLSDAEANELFGEYMEEIERVIDSVDSSGNE